MSKPSTRQELIDYCLRRLGYPVLEVNVDEDQIEDLIDDAIQYFQERHFDGVERMLLKHKVTKENKELRYQWHHNRHSGNKFLLYLGILLFHLKHYLC